MGSINDLEKNNIFDDKVFKRKMRVMKIKQTIKTLLIVFITVIIFIPFNEKKTIELGINILDSKREEIKLKFKSSYISRADVSTGLLSGIIEGDITKDIMGIPVKIDEINTEFGYLNKQYNWGSFNGGGPNMVEGEWEIDYYPSGYREIEFFHPYINYKKYRNDLKDIDKINDNKIMEVALSFDKAYKIGDLFTLQSKLKNARITYIWLNEFTNEFLEEHKKVVYEYESPQDSIREIETVGFTNYGGRTYDYKSYSYDYEELMNSLKLSSYYYHNNLYNEIEERGRIKVEDAEVLGLVVQGSKKDIEEIKDLSFIKASAIGVMIEP